MMNVGRGDPKVAVDAIERTLELSASPERVWKALTDPQELAAWFPDEAEVDVRANGGGWWRWEKHGRFAVRFEIVEAPRRLVWSWSHEPGKAIDEVPTTRVEWTLTPRAGGGTTLTVRESGFLTEKHRKENTEGWEHELGELRAHLAA